MSVAYWLSLLCDASVALVDREPGPAAHSSSRNTGVIHRPFYLDPASRGTFAAAARLSYPMWKELAEKAGLPWRQVGTLELALADDEVATLEKYARWGVQNGMAEDELEVLDNASVRAIEPEVRCAGAIHSKTDVSVDFGALTKALFDHALENGVEYLGGLDVTSFEKSDDRAGPLSFRASGHGGTVSCGLLINAAGGGAVDIAHLLGLGEEYTDLHFRGDYWLVDEPFASRLRRNVYTVARHPQFPFLDPHFVVRADGTRQIGPNAALVSGPFTYEGVGAGIVSKLLERPVAPKLKLFASRTFLSLLWTEWRSAVSKTAMCDRVRAFVPGLSPSSLTRRGLSGVRSSVIDRHGFVPEAIQLRGPESLHILNFNSPGATGAPAFSAAVLRTLLETAAVDRTPARRPALGPTWDFDEVAGQLGSIRTPD